MSKGLVRKLRNRKGFSISLQSIMQGMPSGKTEDWKDGNIQDREVEE